MIDHGLLEFIVWPLDMHSWFRFHPIYISLSAYQSLIGYLNQANIFGKRFDVMFLILTILYSALYNLYLYFGQENQKLWEGVGGEALCQPSCLDLTLWKLTMEYKKEQNIKTYTNSFIRGSPAPSTMTVCRLDCFSA